MPISASAHELGNPAATSDLMFTTLKRILRNRLEDRGIHLCRWTPGQVGGLHLHLDLPTVISRPAPIIFDVGANIGQSIDLFHSVFPDAHIVAFEPSERCRALLTERCTRRHLTLLPFALGSREEGRELMEYESSVLNSLLPLDTNPFNRFRDVHVVRTVPVDVRTVDSMRIELAIPHIDLLKIDTQGFDLDVLQGSNDSLAQGRVSAVLVEMNFLPMYVGQANGKEIVSFLDDHGFNLVDYYEKIREGTMLAWCTALFVRRPCQS